MTPSNRPTRRGFTIPELLVAMAVSLGIMVILTEAFRTGMDFNRFAHATGELMSQLQGAGIIITRDMQADHFDAQTDKPRLSDQRLDLVATAASWTPPKRGFFRIVSPIPTYGTGPLGNGYHEQLGPLPLQAADNEGFFIDTATNHVLHFTAIMSGGSGGNTFEALASTNNGSVPWSSRAAEIAYFLAPTGESTTPGPTGRPLYNLIRRQRLVAVTDEERTSFNVNGVAADTEVIAGNGTTAYTLADLTDPAKRLDAGTGSYSPCASAAHLGEDILLSNVLSYEVLVDWTPNFNTGMNTNNGFQQSFKTGVGVLTNTEYPYDYLSIQGQGSLAGKNIFDTWYVTNDSVPLAIRVKSIQITARLFDRRVKVVRQTTWRYAM